MQFKFGLFISQFYDWYNNEYGVNCFCFLYIFINGFCYCVIDGEIFEFVVQYDVMDMKYFEIDIYIILCVNWMK